MNRTIYSFNDFHLGDNLIFLHLLRALAKQRVSQLFVHFCGAQHHAQLQEVVADLPNILLESFESPLWAKHHKDAINVWKNSEDAWVNSPLRWDWSAYTLWHHGVIARRMGFESPLSCREHLLFDFPALESPTVQSEYFALVVNSEPCSGQFSRMAKHGTGYLNDFIRALLEVGKRVAYTQSIDDETDLHSGAWCTSRSLLTVSDIGSLSRKCRHHIMIATGPMWTSLNTANHHSHEGRHRIVMMDAGEQLNLPGITQVSNVEQVFEIANREGWL